MEYRSGISREQVSLFPESIEDLIPEDHPIRVIDQYIDGLDIQALGFSKSRVASQGRPPYDPRDLLRLYLYGYFNRVRSSRRLEAECHRNVEVMWLLRRLAPDHKTIANFRKDEGHGLQAVCRNFVQFCRRAGLIAGEMVAIDGSKFQAVASRNRACTDKDLAGKEEIVNARIATYLAQLDAADCEDREHVDRGAVQAALKRLQTEREEVETQRKTFKGTRRTHQIANEPDARLVKDAQGRNIAGYNVQSAVDSRHKLIVHHDVVSEGNDLRQLLPMAQAVKQVLEQKTLSVVADAGYSNGEHLAGCEANGIIPYVALARGVNPRGDGNLFDRRHFTYDQVRDHFTCPAGATLIRKQISRADRITIYAGLACQGCALKPQCTTASQRFVSRHFDEDSFTRTQARMDTQPQMMRLRGAIVEHPFGNLKRWIFGDGRYLVRGLDKVKGETALAVLAYNLRRTMNLIGNAAIRRMLKA